MAKEKDFIAYIEYEYFNKDKKEKILTKYKKAKEIWNPIDLRAYGRCYTAQPTEEMISYGIKKVTLMLYSRSMIFFHNPGMLTTDRQRTAIDIATKQNFDIDLEHEVFHMLDFGGGPCIKDSKYTKDLCAHEHLFQVGDLKKCLNFCHKITQVSNYVLIYLHTYFKSTKLVTFCYEG